jgi:hypothetical protein
MDYLLDMFEIFFTLCDNTVLFKGNIITQNIN